MIKLISEALDSFMMCTKKEIENMKKIGELSHECINIDREKMYKLSGMLEERDNYIKEKYEQQQRSILHIKSILKNMEGNNTQMKNINQAYIHKQQNSQKWNSNDQKLRREIYKNPIDTSQKF